MFKFEWDDNRPFYPSYQEIDGFVLAHGGDLNSLRLNRECWVQMESNSFCYGNVGYTLREGIEGVTIGITHKTLQTLKFIAVFSDGITQIDGIDWKDAVVMALSFKNTKGEFAKRRMIRTIKDTQKTGKGPLDDIAYAVIRVENNE